MIFYLWFMQFINENVENAQNVKNNQLKSYGFYITNITKFICIEHLNLTFVNIKFEEFLKYCMLVTKIFTYEEYEKLHKSYDDIYARTGKYPEIDELCNIACTDINRCFGCCECTNCNDSYLLNQCSACNSCVYCINCNLCTNQYNLSEKNDEIKCPGESGIESIKDKIEYLDDKYDVVCLDSKLNYVDICKNYKSRQMRRRRIGRVITFEDNSPEETFYKMSSENEIAIAAIDEYITTNGKPKINILEHKYPELSEHFKKELEQMSRITYTRVDNDEVKNTHATRRQRQRDVQASADYIRQTMHDDVQPIQQVEIQPVQQVEIQPVQYVIVEQYYQPMMQFYQPVVQYYQPIEPQYPAIHYSYVDRNGNRIYRSL